VPVADKTFVSLADVLRPTASPACVEEPQSPVVEIVTVHDGACTCADAIARDVRVFRARLADAFAAAEVTLVRELACAILGRELLLAPADVAAMAARIIGEHPAAQPVRLRVAHDDTYALAAHASTLPPFVADATLAAGDVIVEFAEGHIEASLGVRLAVLLEDIA
jgi:flagellar biosynthesis/type III secretory pathway protein FliH